MVGNHQKVQIKFWCYASRGVSGDSIAVAISTDTDSNTWQIIRRFSRDSDFRLDKTWYERTVEWWKPNGVQSIKLRISTAATSGNSKGKVYLENISIEGN